MIDDAFLPKSGARRPAREPDHDHDLAILRRLEEHGATEGELLSAYQSVAERTSSGDSIRYLVKLILEDEERHHQVFAEMANDVRSFLWDVPVEPRLPAMRTRSDPDLLAETKRLLAFEKQDAKELRRLRKAVGDHQPSSISPLMVDLMLLDTKKHIAILEFIKSRLSD